MNIDRLPRFIAQTAPDRLRHCRGRWIRQYVRVAVVFIVLGMSPIGSDPKAAGEPQRTVRVALYQNLPKVGLDDDGQPRGVFVDLIEAIARAEGWQLEYLPGTWRQGLEGLENGTIDLMPDVALTADRDRRFDFHGEPVLSSWHQIYTRPDSTIRSLVDLDRRRVAVLEGSIQQDQLEGMVEGFGLSVDVIARPDYHSAFESVVKGDADAVVTNRLFGERHAAAAGLEDTAIIFAPSSLYFAAPANGSEDLLKRIDKHLREFKQTPDSVYFQSLEKWSHDLPPARLPDWIPYAALAVLSLLIGVGAIALVLRREVKSRTATIRQQAEAHNRELKQRVDERTRELAETSRLLQAMIDQIPAIIFYKDTRLRFIGCNHAYERAFAVRCEEILGKTVLDVEFLPPAQRKRYQAEQQRILDEGGTTSREVSITFADGSCHDLLYSATRVNHDDGSPLALIGVLVDISSQKRFEKQLARALQRAEAADRVKSTFLATMSHELRTPLNSIIGFTGILLQELAGPLNEEQRRQLDMVRDSSRHLLALINDVLDISRIEAGELGLQPAPLDLADCIRRTLEVVRPLAEGKRLTLEQEIDDRLGTRIGDRRRIEQILLNLTGNAVKFTRHGRVAISATSIDGQAGHAVRICVRDTGIGIDSKDIANLFKPFWQVDSTLAREHEGTGLGLAICKRLVDLMGGRIEVETCRGQGSLFTVILPLERSDTVAAS